MIVFCIGVLFFAIHDTFEFQAMQELNAAKKEADQTMAIKQALLYELQSTPLSPRDQTWFNTIHEMVNFHEWTKLRNATNTLGWASPQLQDILLTMIIGCMLKDVDIRNFVESVRRFPLPESHKSMREKVKYIYTSHSSRWFTAFEILCKNHADRSSETLDAIGKSTKLPLTTVKYIMTFVGGCKLQLDRYINHAWCQETCKWIPHCPVQIFLKNTIGIELGYKTERSRILTDMALLLLECMTMSEFAALQQYDKKRFVDRLIDRWITTKPPEMHQRIVRGLMKLNVMKYLQEDNPSVQSTASSVWRYIIAYTPELFHLVKQCGETTALDLSGLWIHACRYAHMEAIQWITECTSACCTSACCNRTQACNHTLACNAFRKGLEKAVRGTLHSKRNVHPYRYKFNEVVLYVLTNHSMLAHATIQSNPDQYVDLLKVAKSVHQVDLARRLIANKVSNATVYDELELSGLFS